MKKKIVIILVIIVLIQIITRLYLATKKEYFHMDEMYSYGLMNYDKLNIADNKDFLNTWHTKDYYKDYLEINKNEISNLKPVYENQKNDVHPPLYYLLLRIAATFTIDNFSKWTGIILNIIIFGVSSIFTYLIAKIIFKNPIYSIICCMINGFTIISLDSSIYIRMYELCNLNILIITYLHLKIYRKKYLKVSDVVQILVFMILGGLTHYYFFIYVLALFFIYLIKFLKNKEYKNLIIYCTGALVAAIAYVIIFPHSISHIFLGYRGINTTSNLIINLLGYIWIIDKKFFNYLLPLFIVSIVFLCSKREKRKIILNKKIILLNIPILLYLVVIIKKAPYIESRYIMPIYSVFTINLIYFTKIYLEKYWDSKKTLFIVATLFITIICSPIITNAKLEFTYTQYNNITKIIEKENNPIIYIFNTKENRFLDDIYLFTLVDKSIIVDYDNFNKEMIKNQKDSFILICNKGVDKKEIERIINVKQITHLQKINESNIYKITLTKK